VGEGDRGVYRFGKANTRACLREGDGGGAVGKFASWFVLLTLEANRC
jgi:hypothetical protein